MCTLAFSPSRKQPRHSKPSAKRKRPKEGNQRARLRHKEAIEAFMISLTVDICFLQASRWATCLPSLRLLRVLCLHCPRPSLALGDVIPQSDFTGGSHPVYDVVSALVELRQRRMQEKVKQQQTEEEKVCAFINRRKAIIVRIFH
uniref:Uncharacterized protein n=1 Tax=Sphaerodactylus townsendi TaxID=933632 RepID=A0ACB8FCT9_9SAUR